MVIESAFILQTFGDIIQDFFRNIRIIDILDIAIISLFLYAVLNWLRQSASQQSVLSFLILVVVYFVARFTGMYLTELLVEAIFIIILIGIVVVYQSDIRRIIDRLGNWSFFRSSKPRSATDIATSIITEASAKMAETNTGALIAIKGKEDWERHIHGGIELNGQITIPLLRSLFNKYAPGHDGAVLLEGDQIKKFSVHLPLSTNLYKMSRGGTRHTAALGLAEQCDALVVVVSEERGTISIAKDGQIHELESHSDLKKHLDEFWAEHYQSESTSLTQWWKRRSLRTAISAFVLALILWIAFAYPSGTVYRTYNVPIEYRNLQSANVSLEDSVPIQARVTLSGPEQAFRTLDPSNLAISFNLEEENIADSTLEIGADDMNLPTDVNFFESSPPFLKLKSKPLASVQVPVKVATTGSLRNGLQLVSISASPTEIELLTDTTATRPDSITTDPVDLADIQTTTEIQKRLQLESDTLQLPENTSRQVTITIKVRKSDE